MQFETRTKKVSVVEVVWLRYVCVEILLIGYETVCTVAKRSEIFSETQTARQVLNTM